jgi:hypothetical protein
MNRPEGQIVVENMGVADIKPHFVLSSLKADIENHLVTVVAWIIAAVFLFTALVNGFSLKSLFGGNSLFVANAARNTFDFAYLATAIGIIITTLLGEKKSVSFLRVIGKVYVLASLIGIVKIGYYNYSEWTSVINLALGISMIAAGSILQDYRHDLLVARLIAKQRHHGNCVIMDTIKKSNLRYGTQKRYNDTAGKIYCHEDFFETSCIKGEFI